MSQKAVDQTIKLRINFLQEQLGFTSNRKFAGALDMDPSQFSKIGKGELPLSLDAAMTISRKFGVNLHWLFMGIGSWKNGPHDHTTKLLAEQWKGLAEEEFEKKGDQQPEVVSLGKLDQSDRELLLEILINQKATLQYLREIQNRLGPGVLEAKGSAAISEVKEMIKKGKLAGKGKQSNRDA